MAAAAKKAAKDREDTLMDRFQTMQDGMAKAFADQTKAASMDAAKRQEDMLTLLIPKLIQAQPGAGVKTGANTLGVGVHSHTLPSTGLIAAAASGYDHQASPLAHLIGDISSGITTDDPGNKSF
jgi:hypothetical protein